MQTFFEESGWTIYPTALFGLLMIGSSLVYWSRPQRRFIPLVGVLSALTLLSGLLGTMWGLTGIVKTAANTDVPAWQTIMVACATQALNSLLLAFACMAIAALGAAAGAARVLRAPVAPASL